LLELCYFKLLCQTDVRCHGTYDALLEDVPGKGPTYTVHLSGRETDKMMQKVADAANGIIRG
jgi:hypothetical protein